VGNDEDSKGKVLKSFSSFSLRRSTVGRSRLFLRKVKVKTPLQFCREPIFHLAANSSLDFHKLIERSLGLVKMVVVVEIREL